MRLDEQIAAIYGVKVTTAPLVPLRSARPESLVLAAEQVAIAIGDHRPRRPTTVEPAWTPLPTRAAPPVDAAATLDRLLTWARAHEIAFDGIEIALAADGNRSVRARRDFAEDEPVMTVPRRHLILDVDAAASPVGVAIGNVLTELRSGHTVMSAWLATEQTRPDSPWRPYLDALPAAIPGMPMFHGRADLELLAGTCARAAIRDARDSVAEDHEVIARLPALAALPLAEFAWARAILGSRAFKIGIDGQDLRALVPIADFFDHGSADATWVHDDDAQAFVVRTLRPIAAGEEIRFSYGAYDNGRYLVGYGFATAANPEDEVFVRFAPATDPRTDLAGHLVWNLPLGLAAPLPLGTCFDDRARRVLSVARLRAATPRELVAASDRGRFHKRELRWLGSRIELAALEALAGAAKSGISAIPAERRTVAEPSRWQRTCADVRHSERALLEQIVAFTAAAAPHVAAPSEWAWRRAAEAIAEDATGADRLLRGYLLAAADELPR